MKRMYLFLMIVLSFAALCFAGTKVKDVVDGILSVNGLAAGLGVGVLGLFGLLSKFRKALKEASDVVVMIRARAVDPALIKEADEALEAFAEVLKGVGLKRQAQQLSDLIK